MLSAFASDAKLFLTLLLLSCLLLISDQLNFLNFPKSQLQLISSPIQYGLYKTSLGAKKQFEFIVLVRRASQENKALTEQLASALSENANLRRKLAETEGFLEQQKVLDPQNFKLVASRPIGIGRFLTIDKGSNNGLKLGQPVVYKDNYLGKIKILGPEKSQVMLSSDPDSRMAAFVSNQNGRAKGVLSGQFGSEMLLDKILHQEKVEKGDLVYSEGTEGEIPRGLVLGTVSQVLERENEVFKQAKVKPVFDVTNLDILFVITN